MAYASFSVVFGEQPSAAKWNILGTNDASFNDGTGIGTNAIAAASLATNALKISNITTTANFTTSSGTAVLVTNLTTGSITMPAGGRSFMITATLGNVSADTALTTPTMTIWDGTVGSGTQLGQWRGATLAASTYLCGIKGSVMVTPAAGAKTYNVGIASSAANQITANATATAPNNLIVYLI